MTAQADDSRPGTNGTHGTVSATPTEDFQRLLTSEARFAPSPAVLANANVKDYQALYDEAGYSEGWESHPLLNRVAR